MKNCPDQEKIAALDLGVLPASEAKKLLKHLSNCPRCRPAAEQFHRLQLVLQHLRPQSGGSYQFVLPVLSQSAVASLKQSVVAEFTRRQQSRLRLATLIKRAWDQIVKPDLNLAPEVPVFGYAATRPRKRSKAITIGQAELAVQLQEHLVDLLESLLDPSVPLAQRVRWAALIQKHLVALSKPAATPRRRTKRSSP